MVAAYRRGLNASSSVYVRYNRALVSTTRTSVDAPRIDGAGMCLRRSADKGGDDETIDAAFTSIGAGSPFASLGSWVD